MLELALEACARLDPFETRLANREDVESVARRSVTQLIGGGARDSNRSPRHCPRHWPLRPRRIRTFAPALIRLRLVVSGQMSSVELLLHIRCVSQASCYWMQTSPSALGSRTATHKSQNVFADVLRASSKLEFCVASECPASNAFSLSFLAASRVRQSIALATPLARRCRRQLH